MPEAKLLVIFTIILVGVFCERKKIFSDEQGEGIQIFLYHVSMPCFLFAAIMQQDLPSLFNVQYVVNYLLAFVVVGLLVLWAFYKQQDKAKICMRIFAAGYVNAGIYVLPVTTFLLKDPIAAVLANLLQVLVIQTIFIVVLSFFKHREKSMISKIFIAFTTPIVLLPMIALVCNYYNINVHHVIVNVIESLGGGASNIALFAFGLMLGGFRITRKLVENKDLLAVVAIKCFVHPLVSFCMAKYIFNLDGYWLYALLIASSGPTAFASYRVAASYNVEKSFVKDTIAMTSVTSLFSLVIIALLL